MPITEMRELEKLSDSNFFRRINDASLKALVEEAAKNAAVLLGTVDQDMPLFTLHNERHILNVLAWMEDLLPPGTIDELGQLECALCILAAYTHDLGMTLNAAERAALPDDPDYRRHRNRFPEECRLIEQLRNNGEHGRAAMIEGFLRTDFIRATHADKPAKRLRGRIGEIAGHHNYEYAGFPFQPQLEWLAISHNCSAEWLRLTFEKESIPWHAPLNAHGERVNFAFIGLLLRLADIMDFDASRTPSILFRHLGLDRDLSSPFERFSAEEWRKHMAITAPAWSQDRKTLEYTAAACTHPAIEKSIRHFVGAVQQEVRHVSAELRHVVEAIPDDRDRLRIHLPEVTHRITPALLPGGTKRYEYHDWHFRLDQDEIIRLLMGESLYGDPSLCIRELLQNSLDALELRDLRLQLKRKAPKTLAQPVDGVTQGPGRFTTTGEEEQLAVTLSWGEKDGLQFIRVEDNGVGMTLQTIERYFTQIGKSFYRSPDFLAEQAELRGHGLLCTPISTFGIGVLSCFMIADRVQVRTHPGAVAPDRPALDLEISGPGSVFWTRPGTRDKQGTEVTLWLRQAHKIDLKHDRERCFDRLRERFGYRDENPGDTQENNGIDPGFVAASHVVWPKYPVRVQPPSAPAWTIDDRFHLTALAPLDVAAVRSKLGEWDYPADALRELSWEPIDWIDNKGQKATGTRLRIWFPRASGSWLATGELLTFLSPQIREQLPRVLTHSMSVEDPAVVLSERSIHKRGLGYRIWLDLRGEATPRLTVDRKRALLPKPARDWRATFESVWSRFVEHSALAAGPLDHLLWQSWPAGLRGKLRARMRAESPASVCRKVGLPKAVARSLAVHTLRLDLDSNRDRELARAMLVVSGSNVEPNGTLTFALSVDLGRAFAPEPKLARDLALDVHRVGVSVASQRDVRAYDPPTLPEWPDVGALYDANWLQEGFFPNLEESLPLYGLQWLQGAIGDAVLTAPGECLLNVDKGLVIDADPTGAQPETLSRRGYDLCFPMTAVPLGALRRDFPKWRCDRKCRPLGVLPFLLPDRTWTWRIHVDTFIARFAPIRQIYALQPPEELWFKEFTTWTPEDWRRQDHRSLLWDIPSGRVLIEQGIHPRQHMLDKLK